MDIVIGLLALIAALASAAAFYYARRSRRAERMIIVLESELEQSDIALSARYWAQKAGLSEDETRYLENMIRAAELGLTDEVAEMIGDYGTKVADAYLAFIQARTAERPSPFTSG